MIIITQHQQVVSEETVSIVEFGCGDILISAIDSFDKSRHGLILSQDEPKPEEEWDSISKKKIEDLKNPIFLWFNKEKSVDQFIKSLTILKEKFHEQE